MVSEAHPGLSHEVGAAGPHTGGHGDGHAGALQHQFDDIAQQRESNSLGMWLFLATEVMMFGGLFFAYSLFRWKFDAAFHEASLHQNVALGTVNTFILLFSSLTMALAVHAAGSKKTGRLLAFLAITWLMGLGFLIVKAFEWGHDLHIGLIPGVNWSYYDDPHHLEELLSKNIGVHEVKMFWTIYFCMTGLHAIHMVVGLLVVGGTMIYAAKGAFLNGNDQPVEIVGLYWHLVDIIWIFLFPLLYLIAGFHPERFLGGGGH